MSCLSLTFADLDRLTGDRRGVIEIPCPSPAPTRGKPPAGPLRGIRIERLSATFVSFACRNCGVAAGLHAEASE